MKWTSWIVIGVLLMFVCLLSGCSSDDLILIKSSSGTITNSITNNITINNTYYINTTNNITNNMTNNITNTILPSYLRGINNNTYSADVLEEENYFNSPFFGYGCYENWLLQSEDFGTTWIKRNGTAIINNNAVSPIGTLIAENSIGNTSLNRTQIYQTITSNSRNNVTFSIWLRTFNNNVSNATIHLQLHSNNDSFYPQPIYNISITNYWNRYNITTNFNFNHTIKNITIFQDEINISLWGAQLENGTRPTINGVARTTTGNYAQICGSIARGNQIIVGTTTTTGVTSTGGVAVGGALSGATSGAFTGTIQQSTASTLNRLALYGLILAASSGTTTAIPSQGAPLLTWRSKLWNGTVDTNQEWNIGTTGDNFTKTTSWIFYNKNHLNENTSILNITHSIISTSRDINITLNGNLTLNGNIKPVSYITSNGTTGFTGTCTILGLTNFVVKDGLIIGCS